jgi:hypothetical protein
MERHRGLALSAASIEVLDLEAGALTLREEQGV